MTISAPLLWSAYNSLSYTPGFKSRHSSLSPLPRVLTARSHSLAYRLPSIRPTNMPNSQPPEGHRRSATDSMKQAKHQPPAPTPPIILLVRVRFYSSTAAKGKKECSRTQPGLCANCDSLSSLQPLCILALIPFLSLPLASPRLLHAKSNTKSHMRN